MIAGAVPKALLLCISLALMTCRGCSCVEDHPVLGALKCGKNIRPPAPVVEALDIDEGCWMYQGMPKSGSSTVLSILAAWATRNNLAHARFTSDTLLSPEEPQRILHGNYSLVTGGFTEALRAMGGGGGCKWFTVFRHPVARLVSAYYYCKHKDSSDQICGKELMDHANVSLYAFAELWSNYGTREFVMSFVTPDEVMTSPAVRAVASEFPGWYKIGVFAEELYRNQTTTGSAIDAPTGLHDEAMEQFLRPAMDLLETYDAVGLIEDFDNTMSLFDAALGMPGLDWAGEFRSQGVVNEGVDQVRAEQAETLRSAWTDPILQRFLWLDMSLYDHAVAVHHKQLSRFGLA